MFYAFLWVIPPAYEFYMPTFRNTLINVHVLMNGNELGLKGVELLAVFGTSMSKGFLDNEVPETIKGRNILGQKLRPGVLRKSRYCS